MSARVMDTSSYTMSTVTATALDAPDLDAMLEQIKLALAEPEPIAQWMAAQGFDPAKKNGRLIIPMSMRPKLEELGPIFWPWYVRFSPYVGAVTLIRDMGDLWRPRGAG